MGPNLVEHTTHWLPGLIVLGIAALAAGLLLLLRKKEEAASPDTGPVADAEQRLQDLLGQLRELQADRHLMSAEQFQAEQERLEGLAAVALRERDQLAHPPPGARTPAPPRPQTAAQGYFARHPQMAGALWGGGGVLFFVVLGLLLGRAEKPRTDGQPITGGAARMSADAAPADTGQRPDAELDAALEELRAHPENTELGARVGHELIRRRDFERARQVTERALGADPFQVENRIHRAFLWAVFDTPQKGIHELTHLADTYPDSYEALLFLGMVQMTRGDRQAALAAFQRYSVEAPHDELPPQLMATIAQLKAHPATGP